MSTQNTIRRYYKLASGAILDMGELCHGDYRNQDVMWQSNYFLCDWIEENLEALPNKEYEWIFPFEKMHELIEKCNKALVFVHQKNTDEIINIFPHIKKMSVWCREHSGIYYEKKKYVFNHLFFSLVREITDRLPYAFTYEGDPDVILTIDKG